MLFASFDFLLFFAVALAGYWALAAYPRGRCAWIFATSYFFYMAAPKPVDGPLPTPWYFAGLLLASTLVDYTCGLCIARAQRRAGAVHRPGKPWVAVSVTANLGLLAFFKYTGFLAQVVTDAAALLGVDAGLPVVRLLLPVGISFYTFQSLSYTIDVYRGDLPAERNFLRFAAFMAFFPQLMAGPIMRAREFLPQFRERPRLTREDVDFATYRIFKGLAKKLLLADFIAASFTDRVFAAPAEHSSLENLIALYAFTLQIYADFSGYSDIAIGAGRLLGIQIPENFNRPYRAVDVADFWRRWHMTLSRWLRDYVYYPLGGSRQGPVRNYLNLGLTMFLVGIWHGASWNFVIYALVQAFAMLFNRAARPSGSWGPQLARLGALAAVSGLCATTLGRVLELQSPWSFGLGGAALAVGIALLPKPENAPGIVPLHVLLTLHFSVLSRVFFRSENLESARITIGKLTNWDGIGVRAGLFKNEALAHWLEQLPALAWARPLADWSVLLVLLAGFALHYTPAERLQRGALEWLPRVPAVLVGVGIAIVLGISGLLLAGPRPNIYFAF